MANSARNAGVVEAVRGSVVDATFSERIPSIFHVLTAGDDGRVVVEVVSHLDSKTVRGVALTSTRGLSRGSAILDTQRPLKVPVGERVLGRMFDVFGNSIDRKPALDGGEWRSIHGNPVPLMRRATTSELFVTGIKAIDVLAPLERGGKSARHVMTYQAANLADSPQCPAATETRQQLGLCCAQCESSGRVGHRPRRLSQ